MWPSHVDGYQGVPAWFVGAGDPASEAISGKYGVMSSGASGAISDCRYADYGVGFFRTEDFDGSGLSMDNVSIVLGQPAEPVAVPPPPPSVLPGGALRGGALPPPLPIPSGAPEPVVSPQPPTSPPPPPTPTATVTSDVDLYDVPGGNGNIIGMLRQGQVIKVVKACPSDDWCDLTDPKGSAWGSFLRND